MSSESYTEEYARCVMVTGGVGFVGSHIAEALLKEGRKVVVYDLFNSETTGRGEKNSNATLLENTARENFNKGADLVIVKGDIRDQEKLLNVISSEQVTGCIHVGGMVDDRRSMTYPKEYIDVNVVGTAMLLDALGKSGVKMVVQASTRSVFGERPDSTVVLDENAPRRPINPYGVSKVAADAMAHCYCNLYKMNLNLIRIFATYGPRGRPDMIPRILTENVYYDKPIPKFGDGTATRTWIYISDVVDAFLLALKHPQGGFSEFNTGTDFSTTLNELIAVAEEVQGKRARIEHHPVPPGDANTVGIPNYDKISRVLGWRPRVDLKQGLQLVYKDYAASQTAIEADMYMKGDKEISDCAAGSL